MQGSCHLHKFGDKPAVVPHESQETADLHDIGGNWPMIYSIYLAFVSVYSFGGDHVPKVGKLQPEQLTF